MWRCGEFQSWEIGQPQRGRTPRFVVVSVHNYFAYGSNMAASVFDSRVQGTSLGCGVLRGHRLSFTLPSRRWGGYAADLTALDGASVWGRIWKISEDQLRALDAVEGNYRRLEVTVELMSHPEDGVPTEQVSAITYVVRSERRAPEDGAPAAQYLNHLLAGAEECGLPLHYLKFLRGSSRAPGGSMGTAEPSGFLPE